MSRRIRFDTIRVPAASFSVSLVVTSYHSSSTDTKNHPTDARRFIYCTCTRRLPSDRMKIFRMYTRLDSFDCFLVQYSYEYVFIDSSGCRSTRWHSLIGLVVAPAGVLPATPRGHGRGWVAVVRRGVFRFHRQPRRLGADGRTDPRLLIASRSPAQRHAASRVGAFCDR